MSNESASAEHSNPPGNTDKLDYLWRFIGLVVFYWVAGFVLFVFAILSFGKFCDDLFCDGQHDGFNQALFEVRKYLGQITHYLMTGKDLPFPLGPWPKDDDLGPTP